MVQIKAYRGSEIRRFDIETGKTFAQLKELVISSCHQLLRQGWRHCEVVK